MVAVSFDDVLHQYVGGFGVYQRLLYAAVSLIAVATAVHNLVHAFAAAAPAFTCRRHNANVTANLTVSTGTCPEEGNNGTGWCEHGWTYDQSQYQSTIVTEWDLVCDHHWLPALSQSLLMAGSMLGGIVFGEIADRFGRRLTLLLTTLCTVVIGTCTAFSPNFPTYAAMRFFLGAAINGQFNCGYIIALEYVGARWRVLAGVCMLYAYSLGIIILSGAAWLIRDWHWLILATAAPFSLLLSYYWFIPESPRWLLLQNREQEALAAVHTLAKYNQRDVPDDLQLIIPSKETAVVNLGLVDLCKSPVILLRTIILMFLWLVIGTSYYGLSLYSSSLGSNDYVSFLVSGLVEVPGYSFSLLSITKLGYRLPLAFCLFLAAVTLLATPFIPPAYVIVRLALSMVGKLGVSSAFATVYPLSTELYPTVLRNVGLGLSSTGGKIGGFIAPYVNLLGDLNPALPLGVFGAMALVGCLLVFCLPETHRRPLPETVQQAESVRVRAPWKKMDSKTIGLTTTEELSEKSSLKYCQSLDEK